MRDLLFHFWMYVGPKCLVKRPNDEYVLYRDSAFSGDKRITMARCFCKCHDKRLRRRPATNPLKHDLHTDALPPNHETTGSIGDTPKMFRIMRIIVIVVIEKEVQLTSNWEFPQVEKIVEVLSLVCLTYVTDLTDLPQSPPYCFIDCDIANKPLWRPIQTVTYFPFARTGREIAGGGLSFKLLRS